MVGIDDIPDFEVAPGTPFPGQRPAAGDPPTVAPVAVVLVNCPLDPEYRNIALNAAAVDAYLAAEITAGRAYTTTVERWSPWSDLQVEKSIVDAAQYNYARFSIGGRNWYGFLDADYLNLNDTAYRVTPDVWTTYQPEIGYSTVVRGHVAVAASAAGDASYCLEPESFGPGDLVGYSAYIADPLGTARVLVVSTTDLRADPFVAVDTDVADDNDDIVGQTLADGDVTAPEPVGPPQTYPYTVGSSGWDDLFYYPYTTGVGASMQRPYATGATPSLVDGVLAEGGAFVYPSIAAAANHLSKLAHAPWIADGIQRVVLFGGGSGGSLSPVDLSPTDTIGDFSGAPTWYASLSTEIGYNTTVAPSWTAGLPAEYAQWTKLRTGPFSAVSIADRLGAVSEFDPQAITGLGPIILRFEGVLYPEADVAAWIVGAGGANAAATPIRVPIGIEMPHFAVGRDSVLAGQAAGLSAERSQSAVDMILALQKATVDNSFTLASAFTATQYAIAEAI